MKNFVFYFCISCLFISINTSAGSLSEEAQSRGINSTCHTYLSQLENSYDLNGLNITFAHPDNPSIHPSLHTSAQKFNNGSSFFATTLSPDNEYCYVSAIKLSVIKNQSCNEIVEVRLNEDPTLQINQYGDGSYVHIVPSSNQYQTILVSTGETSCTLTESQMLWPGK